MGLLRLLKILWVTLRYGLDDIAAHELRVPALRYIANTLRFGRDFHTARAIRLRQALEALGPIFVKFGQVLSTRRDLLPRDIADELAKLQDAVPPFSPDLAIQQIELSLGQHPEQLFHSFERTPIASASIAQVHFATLHDGHAVAVKVLRPGMEAIINQDLALLATLAGLVEKIWLDGKRLKPRQVVAEFDKYLHDELDLMREAANASQLARNFAGSRMLKVPKIYWDYCAPAVMVMERMHGIPISQIERLQAAHIDLKKLARNGVEIFFTQVFRDGFFHADMHPGNIYVSDAPADRERDFGCYIALDFGIVGTLTDYDKNYLAQNFLAFFQRDYKRVAMLHIESGWAPAQTRVDELESAIRACCEPIFARPLAQISFGQVLLRLFQTSRRFNIEIQPQLVLLQKTLLNIEGLGRQLDPELDLWQTAQPFLERWVKQQIGWRGFYQRLRFESPQFARIFPQLPRLLYQTLSRPNTTPVEERRLAQPTRSSRLLLGLALIGCLIACILGSMFGAAIVVLYWLTTQRLPLF